jgi:hypothetical protein
MLDSKLLISAFKSLAISEPAPPELGYCQRLKFQAQRLGYNDYHHVLRLFKRPTESTLNSLPIRLLKRVCAQQLPSRSDCAYVELYALGSKIGFYSSWIGWDKNGDEVRVPRRLDGPGTAAGLRSQSESPIYVIERDTELLAWRADWGSTAIVPEDLAKEHFRSLFDRRHLVASEPPMDFVRAKSAKKIAEWNSNICS